MIPASYVLKRKVARYYHRFWHGDRLRTMTTAPVYFFPDCEKFNSDEVEVAAQRILSAPMRLPHDAVMFEVSDFHPDIKSLVAFVVQGDECAEGYLVGACRDANRFTDVLAHASFKDDGIADVEINPNLDSDPNIPKYAENLTAAVWRALGILSQSPNISEGQVPRTRRPKLARAGVTGWTWRIVDIDPSRMRIAAEDQHGSHASPRWHVRRGHWRTLIDGRRVFVRSCEVGDPVRGAVFKDYQVRMGEAA